MKLKNVGNLCVGLLFLSALYFTASHLQDYFGLSVPPALFGIAALFLFLLFIRCVPKAIEKSATPLLAHMSLFFIPAIVAIVNFKTLIFSYYFALILGIVVCTLVSLALTALIASYLMPPTLINMHQEAPLDEASPAQSKDEGRP